MRFIFCFRFCFCIVIHETHTQLHRTAVRKLQLATFAIYSDRDNAHGKKSAHTQLFTIVQRCTLQNKMSISVAELSNASQMIIELIQLKTERNETCKAIFGTHVLIQCGSNASATYLHKNPYANKNKQTEAAPLPPPPPPTNARFIATNLLKSIFFFRNHN